MENATYQEVELKSIVPNPLNPRKRFEGPKFDELVESIKKKGVIEPVLLRPLKKNIFEIVAGERRYRASCKTAEDNGSLNGQKIPAMVRELSDDDAFDLMTIENLHRDDLTELEEAESFKVFIDKKGDGAMVELSKRTGINKTYIRRRVAVLKLPKKALKAWDKGELKYGHLEQLCRLDDNTSIREYTRKVLDWRGGYSVRQLKDSIDKQAISLKKVKFDTEKAGCHKCSKNSEVQKDLFDMGDIKGAHCLDPKCYKKMLNNYLQANWKKTGYRKQHKTNGFRFQGDLSWDEYEIFHSKPLVRCRECENLVTMIYLAGDVYHRQVCVGDKSCFNKKASSPEKSGDGKKEKRQPPDWHGTYFREAFYREQLPMCLQEKPVNDTEIARVALFSLLKSNFELCEWFAVKYNIKDGDDDCYSYYIPKAKMWDMISGMSYDEALMDLKEASIQVVVQDPTDTASRRKIADHLGISLQDEWLITEEYLQKKTKPEIIEIGEKFKLFETLEVQTFLYEKLLKKRGNYKSCKKTELVKIFLKSGVNLAGVVPEEILAE